MTNENKHPVDWDKLMECIEAGNTNGEGVSLNEEEKKLLATFSGFKAHVAAEEMPVDAHALLAKLNERIAKDETATTIVAMQRKKRAWLYAAAVLLPLLIAGLWFWNVHDQKNNAAVAERKLQDVKLILSNGNAVELGINKAVTEAGGQQVAQADQNELVYNSNNTAAVNKLEVPRGKKFVLQLADGTKVWLNAESSLSFPVSFSGNTREVVLIGEAYFKVTHDATKPFIVHTGNANVQVLGTSFNVHAYGNEPMVTTLVEGKVKLSNTKKEELLLAPGEQAIQSAVDNSFRKNSVDVEPFVAWKDNMLLFNNASLLEITKRLEREYDYRFVFSNEGVKNKHYTISLTQAGDIATVLKYLSKTGPFKYTIRGNEIEIGEADN